MIDRLAELCDRVAELEAENARLMKVITRYERRWLREDGEEIAALEATDETAPKEEP